MLMMATKSIVVFIRFAQISNTNRLSVNIICLLNPHSSLFVRFIGIIEYFWFSLLFLCYEIIQSRSYCQIKSQCAIISFFSFSLTHSATKTNSESIRKQIGSCKFTATRIVSTSIKDRLNDCSA